MLVCGLRNRFEGVTVEAALIVRGRVVHERFVGIVARDTSEASIAIAPAATFYQTIGSGQDGGDADLFGEHDVPPRAVTRTAKVHRLDGAEMFGIEDEAPARFQSGPLQGDVIGAGSVTSLAGHIRNQMFAIELSASFSGGVVASEAAAGELVGERPSRALTQILLQRVL